MSFLIHPTLPFIYLKLYCGIRNGVVNIVNRLRAGESEFRIPTAITNFSPFQTYITPPDLTIFLLNGHHDSYLDVQYTIWV